MTTDNKSAIVVASIGAAVTFVVTVGSLLAAYLAGKRERRRVLYSEAVRTAVGWKEMLYRVRRRAPGQEAELVGQFHDLQDKLTYYQAWVGNESKYMKRSYDRLVKAVKEKTEQLITAAWAEPVRPAPGNAVKGDEHPNIDVCVATFLADVRGHLSPLPWRKVAVVWRNREQKD